MYFGVDIGSSSVKGVLLNEDALIVEKKYIRNTGIIDSINKLIKPFKKYTINGIGITGSGRGFGNIIFNADLVKNEIIAHAVASMTYHPEVKTIFEIGGEDSKLTQIENDIVTNFAMNTACFISGEEILTNNFLPCKIEDIKYGDMVATHKGNFKIVTNTFKRKYSGEIVNINCGGIRNINCTPEHLILILKREDIKCYTSKNRILSICKPNKINSKWCIEHKCKKYNDISFEPEWIEAKYVEEGDLIITVIPDINIEKELISINDKVEKEGKKYQLLEEAKEFYFNKELLRILGIYLADGRIIFNRSRRDKNIKYIAGISFTLNTYTKKHYVDEIIETLQKYYDISYKVTIKEDRKTIILDIYNKSLAQLFYYMCGTGAEFKHICEEIMLLPPELQLEIIKIYIDVDGHFVDNKMVCGRAKRGFEVKTISKKLAFQVYSILIRNNIITSISKNKIYGNRKQPYAIIINGIESNKLLNEDKVFNEDRTLSNHSFYYNGMLFSQVKEVKKYNVDNIDVYNLEVEDDESYVVNFVAVHNCAGGTGSVIETIAGRLGVKIEDVGDLAFKSKNAISIAGKCGIFSQSTAINKRNIGVSVEDILMGVCKALVNNYFTILVRNLRIETPAILQGAVAWNRAVIKCFEDILQVNILVPDHPELMGAIGMALLLKEQGTNNPRKIGINTDYKTEIRFGANCSNRCEIIDVKEGGEILGSIGNRCSKCII